MRVDDAARRRFSILLGVVAFLLGGMALSGPLGRLFAVAADSMETASSPRDEAKVAAARAEAARLRNIQRQVCELGQREKWLDAAKLAATDSKARDQNRLGLMSLQAEALYRAGRVTEALPLFNRMLRSDNPVAIADRFALNGDRDAYRTHCEKTLALPIREDVPPARENDRPPRNSPASESNNVAWLCVVGRDGLPDYARPLQLARRAVALARPGERGLFLNTLGVALYRAGNDAEAITTLKESEKIHEEPFNWPFLALAYHRSGDEKSAQKWLRRLRETLTETYGTGRAQDSRYELLLFHREAESVLKSPPQAGKPVPVPESNK